MKLFLSPSHTDIKRRFRISVENQVFNYPKYKLAYFYIPVLFCYRNCTFLIKDKFAQENMKIGKPKCTDFKNTPSFIILHQWEIIPCQQISSSSSRCRMIVSK